MINFNMRCFEINFPERLPPAHREINFNMRCFEIPAAYTEDRNQ